MRRNVEGQAPGVPALFGGVVLDIHAQASGALQRGNSIPGDVRHAPGGVARNVAQALLLLCGPGLTFCALKLLTTYSRTRVAPLLVSAVGDDAAGSLLLAQLASQGLPTKGIRRCAGATTPCVSLVFDGGALCSHPRLPLPVAVQSLGMPKNGEEAGWLELAEGEVAAAVADVTLLERELTPALVRSHLQSISRAPLLLVDGNLQPAAIAEACAAAAAADVPVWFEPVSAAKAGRAARALHHITFLSPNAAELAALAAEVRRRKALPAAAADRGRQAAHPLPDSGAGEGPSQWQLQRGDASAGGAEVAAALAAAAPHLRAVLAAGANNVLLTLGALGAALCRLGRCDSTVLAAHMPALPARVVNCCGAGDCMVAGVLMHLMEGGSAVDAVGHGVAAAQQAVESADSVPLSLSAERTREGAKLALASLTEWSLPLSQPQSNL